MGISFAFQTRSDPTRPDRTLATSTRTWLLHQGTFRKHTIPAPFSPSMLINCWGLQTLVFDEEWINTSVHRPPSVPREIGDPRFNWVTLFADPTRPLRFPVIFFPFFVPLSSSSPLTSLGSKSSGDAPPLSTGMRIRLSTTPGRGSAFWTPIIVLPVTIHSHSDWGL